MTGYLLLSCRELGLRVEFLRASLGCRVGCVLTPDDGSVVLLVIVIVVIIAVLV